MQKFSIFYFEFWIVYCTFAVLFNKHKNQSNQKLIKT